MCIKTILLKSLIIQKMKNKIILAVCFLIIACKGVTQNRESVFIEVEKRLNMIKSFVDRKNSDSTLRRAEAVAFFEKLTKIESESPFIAEMKLNPTQMDYEKWSKWYLQNKSKIYWDKKYKKISVKE